jgi:hypothetical protein
MATAHCKRAVARTPSISAWSVVVALPGMCAILCAPEARWVWMWAVAFGVYAGLKWLSFVGRADARGVDRWRAAAYLLLWPGMDADAFLDRRQKATAGSGREWLDAALNVAFGIGLLMGFLPVIARWSPFAAGWVGIAGIGFVLHFGLLELLSLGWRQVGISAVPIMNAPYRSRSLSEFWGRRWNLAFRDLAHEFVFRPLVGPWGVTAATMAVFLASGVVHDLVISGAAGTGFGLPTLYFLIQAAGLFTERSDLGKWIGLGRGWIGWAFCAIVVVGPLGLLFHRPFIEGVAVPMFEAFGLM